MSSSVGAQPSGKPALIIEGTSVAGDIGGIFSSFITGLLTGNGAPSGANVLALWGKSSCLVMAYHRVRSRASLLKFPTITSPFSISESKAVLICFAVR